MDAVFDGDRLDIPFLIEKMVPGSSLSINTVRKADLKRLKDLDKLPLTSLFLRWLSAPDLQAVPLPPALERLTIWHSNKLKSLKGLEQAPSLSQLHLRGNGPLEDAGILRTLKALRTLSITGDPPSLQRIASLDFLDGMNLGHIELRAVEGADLDLGPIARLQGLRTIDLHGPNFAPAELAKVAAAHPAFLERLMDLPDAESWQGGCKKCGKTQKVLFLRGKKGVWCPECQREGLDKVLNEFRELVAAAR